MCCQGECGPNSNNLYQRLPRGGSWVVASRTDIDRNLERRKVLGKQGAVWEIRVADDEGLRCAAVGLACLAGDLLRLPYAPPHEPGTSHTPRRRWNAGTQ